MSDGAGVTLENMWFPPHHVWAFQHTRELITAQTVARGDRVRELPRAIRDLDDFTFSREGASLRFGDVIDESFVDGLMVVHEGSVIFERYANGMAPETRHICQSVSKSMTAALAGALIGKGVLSPDDLVTEHLPELVDSAWEGATVRHLLDMTAGVAFDESDYEDEDSESFRGFRVMGWLPRLSDDPTPMEYFAGLRAQGAHGERFEYRSVMTDVLGCVIERAGGALFAELLSREIWQPMGAESDADSLVGPGDFAMVDGGICVTLADLARFGLLFLDGGVVEGEQVLPASWVSRLRTTDVPLAELYLGYDGSHQMGERAFHHDQWWISDAEAGIYSGYGIYGQQVFVHHPSKTVVARFSSWPRPSMDDVSTRIDSAIRALCDSLA